MQNENNVAKNSPIIYNKFDSIPFFLISAISELANVIIKYIENNNPAVIKLRQ
jgi:hypothetical protein